MKNLTIIDAVRFFCGKWLLFCEKYTIIWKTLMNVRCKQTYVRKARMNCAADCMK